VTDAYGNLISLVVGPMAEVYVKSSGRNAWLSSDDTSPYVQALTRVVTSMGNTKESRVNIPDLYSVVPSLELPDLHGRLVSLWTYKHSQPVVLVFCSPDERELLKELAEHYPAYQQTGAEILTIMTKPPDVNHLPFPVLIDNEGKATMRFVEQTPALLLLDSYSVLFARLAGPWPQGLPHQDILQWVALKEMQCPECAVPDWPGP